MIDARLLGELALRHLLGLELGSKPFVERSAVLGGHAAWALPGALPAAADCRVVGASMRRMMLRRRTGLYPPLVPVTPRAGPSDAGGPVRSLAVRRGGPATRPHDEGTPVCRDADDNRTRPRCVAVDLADSARVRPRAGGDGRWRDPVWLRDPALAARLARDEVGDRAEDDDREDADDAVEQGDRRRLRQRDAVADVEDADDARPRRCRDRRG